MKTAYASIGLIVVSVIVATLLTALPTYLLWNWLMPEIFGLTKIDFWQALGLSMLSACLFKGTGSSS